MPTASSVLAEHTVFHLRSLDRLLLNAYLPTLQTSGAVVRFLGRDGPVPSPALFERRSDQFVRELTAYATARGCYPFLRLARGTRKEEALDPVFAKAEREGRSGLVAVVVGQERTRAWRAKKVTTPTGAVSFDWSRASVYVNHFYLYLLDPECGRSFIKICSYAPFAIQLYMNGHEWLKRQLRRREIAFRPLDNGLLSCADPVAAQELASSLGPDQIRDFFARNMAELPQPLTAADRAAGYGYALSMWQVEVADTRVFDRPLRARQYFEASLPELLSTGRPAEVSLLFGRRKNRRTPGRFETSLITMDTLPAIRFRYKRCVAKQYLKCGKALRTETTFNDSYDVGVGRKIENLPALQAKGEETNARFLDLTSGIEQARLAGPELTDLVLPARDDKRRIPALRFGDPRVMALLAALMALAHQALGFNNAQLRRSVAALQSLSLDEYSSARMTYDLGRLAGHGLVERTAGTHRYRLTPFGLRVAASCTKLADRVLDPLIARCDPAPPSPPGTPWRRLEAALDAVLERANIAA